MSKSKKPAGTVDDFVQAAECLKALAHPVRLRMVQLLLHGRYSVGELAEDCSVPQNVASEHLDYFNVVAFLLPSEKGGPCTTKW